MCQYFIKFLLFIADTVRCLHATSDPCIVAFFYHTFEYQPGSHTAGSHCYSVTTLRLDLSDTFCVKISIFVLENLLKPLKSKGLENILMGVAIFLCHTVFHIITSDLHRRCGARKSCTRSEVLMCGTIAVCCVRACGT